MSNTYDNELEYKKYWLMVGLHPTMLPGICEVLYQDEHTGLLRWVKDGGNSIKAGDVAGSVMGGNECIVQYKLRKINASSIVWLMHHGVLPPNGYVKYKDDNPRNLRIDNLFLKP
jgi:hypothetical protein